MAIDATGKPTTTGMMDSRPKVPKAPNLSNLGKANKKVSPSPQPVTERKADPIQDELANRLKNDKEWYELQSKTAKNNFNVFFSEKEYIYNMEKVMKEVMDV